MSPRYDEVARLNNLLRRREAIVDREKDTMLRYRPEAGKENTGKYRGGGLMTPEELKEFREWCRTFEVPSDSMIMKALEHIDQQAAQLAEYRRPMESMDTEQLSQWNVELSTLLCMPVSDRENLWWQIAVGDHLEKFAKSWHSSRIAKLEAEVKRLSEPNACDDWGNPVVLGVSGGSNDKL